MPSVNIWFQRREAHSTAAKPAATSAGGAISGNPTPALREGFKDTIDPGLYAFQALEGETRLRKTGNIAQPEQNGIWGSTVTERNATAIKLELPSPIDGSFSWPAPMKEEKERVAGSFCPHDKTGTQAFTFQAKPRHKQKWVAYNYVPSVKFEIQISPLRRSKPRRGGQSASFASSSDVICSRDRTETTSLLSARTRSYMDPSDAVGQKRTQRKNSGAKIGDPASFHPREGAAADPRKGPVECRRHRYRSMRRGQSIDSADSQLHYDSFALASGSSFKHEYHYSPADNRTPKYMSPSQENTWGSNSSRVRFHQPSPLPEEASGPPLAQTQLKPWVFSTSLGCTMPFSQPLYWQNIILQHLKDQIEYYFSIENLCKDIYLRKRMDSQGFVDLHFVAAFKRMRELTTDMNMIRTACEASTEVEYIISENANERLRRISNRQDFLLLVEDRDGLRPT
ncbi:La domain-containingfamily [Purpureocillium lilacinum]|uniref:La domain-containingfamily n=1 Tax=Purpureocillium lilacinum TaxID=33203 RepID=A0A179F791_PURLI|nr:La domain-containingfamily [Purpureocillium lilacinum]